jgi:hypothetical protein
VLRRAGLRLERGGGFGAGADAELLERVREMRLDGALRHVQPLGDRAVAVPTGGQPGDAVLGRGERAVAALR